MVIEPGTTLGQYRIVAKLGEGGMGEVYRGEDSRLMRDVAIKVLPTELVTDADRLARLKREAQVLAQLEHPNVAGIHGLEEIDGHRLLVMQLANGRTLADRLEAASLPVEDALEIARQIAEGLEAAHERGIVHRDLKSANVMVDDEGSVKILDFGLAKALGPDGSTEVSPQLTASPTVMDATIAGMIMGTAAYMSPEQARGKPVDRRADIWTFGCVLYEMLTGVTAFGGETVTDVLAAVVRGEPDRSRLPALPVAIRGLLDRCLIKEPLSRLRDIGEARIVLEHPAEELAVATSAERTPAAGLRLVWVGAAMVAAAAAGWALKPTAGSLPATTYHLSIAPPDDIPLHIDRSGESTIDLSASGRFLLFHSAQGSAIYVLDLHGTAPPRPIAGTEGGCCFSVSLDEQWVAFVRDQLMYRVRLEGGPVDEIADLRGNAQTRPRWNLDGTLLIPTNDGVLRLDPASGQSTVVMEQRFAGSTGVHMPSELPHDGGILYTLIEPVPKVMLLDVATGASRLLYDGGYEARYVETGHIVFAEGDTLMAMPFDPSTGAAGAAVPLLQIDADAGDANAHTAISRSGTLVYLAPPEDDRRRLLQLRPGESSEPLSEVRARFETIRMALSPDQTRLAVEVSEAGGAWGVWDYDLARHGLARLTTGEAWDWAPVWTPDNTGIVFTSEGGGRVRNIHMRTVDSTGARTAIVTDDTWKLPSSFSPDGSTLAYESFPTGGTWDIWIWDRATGQSQPWLATPSNEREAQFSPDGEWVAYSSDESGQFELYIAAYPGPGRRTKVSLAGGSISRWSPRGDRIFYSVGRQVYVAEFNPATTAVTTPELWVEGVEVAWEMIGDGERFITPEPRQSPRINVVVNWFDELERLVPTE